MSNHMKTYRLLQSLCLMLAILATSCTDDTFVYNREQVEEGLPTCVRLNFKAEENKVVTRYAQDEIYENRVDNIYVLVFNGSGGVHYRRFYTAGEGLIYDDSTTKSSGSIKFNTQSLGGATIVGIANLTTPTTSTAYSVAKADLDTITTLSSLKNVVMKMRNQSVDRGALFMMTGYAKDAGNTVVNIPSNESDTPVNCTLELERTDAKVEFIIKAEKPSDKAWSQFSFRPTGWTVKRVPQQSLLLPSDEDKDADGDGCTYFNSIPYEFEEQYRSDADNTLYTGGSFVFYMPENRKQPLKDIDPTDTTDKGKKLAYAQRGASEGTYENGDKIFTNAHANSTYVEITGLLSYFDEKNYLVYANVRFTIHLGYANNDVNDYATLRNHYYTYTITVRGVDDITAEVSGGDENPGYEGDVVTNFQDSFEFDCHYDRRLIKLHKSGFTNAGSVYWGVNTPFSKGVHTVGEDNAIGETMKDYRWIKFAINKKYGVSSDKYVKYPGDQNYNDPYPVDVNNNNQPSPYYSPGGDGYNSEYNTQEARLLDVDQLMKLLKEEANKTDGSPTVFDDDGYVWITVFVDENVYILNPNTGQKDLTLWKKMAETDDRQLYIIVEDAKYTEDEQSSVIKAQYSFRQRSVRTVFNIYDTTLEKAWGLESKMETDRMRAGGVTNGSSKSNGRLNTIRCILGTNYNSNKDVKWTALLGVDAPYSLQGDQTAIRACLLRNRDLNGDNIIDANEIRWYLAAIDQLTDIYIGEYALDEQARLYPKNAADRVDESDKQQVRWHYTSSTANGNEAWIIWAEEGASRGSSGGSIKDEKDTNGNNIKNTYFSYRCIRNLGIEIEAPDDEPESFIKVDQEAGGTYLIDLSKMHINARRTNAEVNALPEHNERNLNNKPYVKFRVHSDVFPTPEYNSWNSSWNTKTWSDFQTWNGYPEGYRIPNQRELLIMATRMPSTAWKTFTQSYYSYGYWYTAQITPFYMCQTSFSMDGQTPYTEDRDGFYWDSNSGNFILQNSTNDKGYVRPVQDVAE